MASFHVLSWHPAEISTRLLQSASASTDTKLSWHAAAPAVFESLAAQNILLTESMRLPEAEELLLKHNLRYACVIDAQKSFTGLLLTRELHSRHSGALCSALQLPWAQLEVRHLMQPLTQLPVVNEANFRKAKIGDIAATMQAVGKDFVLVENVQGLSGFVSSLKVLQLTGESVRLYPKATTFAEVFSALKHPEITEV
ncbi:hypothetical protein IDAT_01265 [Pseudidiomarina atlantica]|jgi:hypothetical protein|uniref:CBS domain-containing protein n=1 Tax=Pseudidiomarina atlantica TaxID=1517416 RepID=A0A094IVB9_9GAMM|nr:hypothetical protein [Pseudidiomarina atlantica]KFZ29759.1 hypothetical protein IDAT_01265 [Pseudidiomarina atlantica]